ncbi:35749_t:CDS:1, partial [Gigaspora margarita]
MKTFKINPKCFFVFLLVIFVSEVYSSSKPSSSSTKPPQEQKQTIQNGEACVFHCKSCASGLGHVAWGFRI